MPHERFQGVDLAIPRRHETTSNRPRVQLHLGAISINGDHELIEITALKFPWNVSLTTKITILNILQRFISGEITGLDEIQLKYYTLCM